MTCCNSPDYPQTRKFRLYLKVHLSPFCTCTAAWFLIQRTIFQSWYMWEKSFSIDLMRHVKIEIPILKNCLVYHDRFKLHILCVELKTVEKIRCPRIGLLGRKDRRTNYIAADVDASWRKERRTRPSHNINTINILWKQKLKSRRINIFERLVKLQANSWHSWEY